MLSVVLYCTEFWSDFFNNDCHLRRLFIIFLKINLIQYPYMTRLLCYLEAASFDQNLAEGFTYKVIIGITGMDLINMDLTWRVAREGNDLSIDFIPTNSFFCPELKRANRKIGVRVGGKRVCIVRTGSN